jgi:hypothetical protein
MIRGEQLVGANGLSEEHRPAPDYQELDSLIMARAGSRHPDDYPERLYHYTTSAAFLSIISSDELWFTDFRYLNDLSEMRYGVDLFKAEVNRQIERESDTSASKLLAHLDQQFDRALVYTDVFVFCMCEENNLLNQWRVYGRDTVPVCLEFATRGFMFVEWEPYSFELVPMVYDTELQNRIVCEAISVGLEYMAKHRANILADEDSMQSYVEMLASICIDWCTSMKHPQFAVEKEWRLATRWGLEHRSLTGRAFRPSPAGIVPYLVMRPKKGNELGEELAVRSVTIGPCSQPEIQKRTFHELLFQRLKADVDVHVSSLPIRP